jgi:hypothetical protein
MPSKNELLNKRFLQMIDEAKEYELPFYQDFKVNYEKYDLEYLVGLIERFIIPVKDDLEGYFRAELDRMKVFYLTQPNPKQAVLDYEPTQEIMDKIVKHTKYLIKVIEY